MIRIITRTPWLTEPGRRTQRRMGAQGGVMQIARYIVVPFVMVGLAASISGAQGSAAKLSPQQAAAIDSAYKKLGVFAYPAKNQSADKQKQDQRECYVWAADQTGYDPLTAK